MKIKPHFCFNGNAEEALHFYATVFNGAIGEKVLYKQFKEVDSPVEYQDKIIHAELNLNNCSFYLADAMPGTEVNFGSLGHTTTLFCDTEQELKEIYEKLSAGGKIKCELCTPPYAKLYAEIVDKFGVLWALIIE